MNSLWLPMSNTAGIGVAPGAGDNHAKGFSCHAKVKSAPDGTEPHSEGDQPTLNLVVAPRRSRAGVVTAKPTGNQRGLGLGSAQMSGSCTVNTTGTGGTN